MWKFLAILGAVGGVLGALPKFIAPLTYTGAANISFPPSPVAKIAAGASQADKDYPALPLLNGAVLVPQSGTAPEAAHSIMESRKTLGRVVDEFKFAQKWGIPRDIAIQILDGKLIFRPGEIGDIKISFTDPDRKTAKAVVARLLEILSEETARIGRETAGDFLSIITKGRADAESELLAKLTVAKEFLNKTDPLPPEDMGTTLGGVYASALTDMIRANVLVAGKGAAVGKVGELAASAIKQKFDPNIPGQIPTTLGGLYDKKITLTAQLNLLKQQYNDDYPEVVAAQRQLDEYNRQLSSEVSRLLRSVKDGDNPYVAPATVEAYAAKAGQMVMDKAVKDLDAKMRALPGRVVKYAFIKADVETATAKVKFWREEEMKAQVVSASRGHSFAVIDPPDAPERPNPRGAFLGFALGAFLGLFLGSFRPYFLWYKSLPKEEYA